MFYIFIFTRLTDLKTAEDEPPGGEYQLVPIKVGPNDSYRLEF